ncbi:MAG: BTAD domain-containing putative transcriptional regulator [Oscillospiraceae bacterium]|nr:BTAD domain-containing putative transcriptional regulator [Oscillospiraceae bacterium]
MKTKQKVEIHFFGRFMIRVDGREMNVFSPRSEQLLTLLEYLAVYRGKSVPQEELFEILWPEETGNPAGALKNLVYRVRTAFVQGGWEAGKELIVYTGAGYAFNTTFLCETDTETFERLLKAAGDETLDAEKRLPLYQTAFDLYRGDFLAAQGAEIWTLPLNRYYHTLYFENLYPYLELLLKKGEYARVQKTAAAAVAIDQFDEKAHQYLMRAFILQKRPAEAVNHYHYIQMLFYNELGVNLTEETEKLYREVFKTVNRVELDFDRIKRDVQETGEIEGAYFCDYSVFKSIYRLEARAAARSGTPCCIALITLDGPGGEPPAPKTAGDMMEQLKRLLVESLRKGDIVTLFSATQYVVLLQEVTEENAGKVVGRLKKRFEKDCGAQVVLLTDIRLMDHIS